MKQTAVKKINEGNLCGKCKIYEHPVPNFIEIILFYLANEENFREIHFTERYTKDYKINDSEKNAKYLIGGET